VNSKAEAGYDNSKALRTLGCKTPIVPITKSFDPEVGKAVAKALLTVSKADRGGDDTTRLLKSGSGNASGGRDESVILFAEAASMR